MVRSNFGSSSRHRASVDMLAASLACSTHSMTFFFCFMKPPTRSDILVESSCFAASTAKSRNPGRSTICMSTHDSDSTLTQIGSSDTDSPSSWWESPTICITCSVGYSPHESVFLSRTNHRERWFGTFLNSSTVGRRLPNVPETKLKGSPASDSISLLLPTDCFPMRMNCGMGKSVMPSLSCTRAFTSPRTFSNSFPPTAIAQNKDTQV
mmetsp:Transcript_13879/g.37956  ORF Transcript_13879/g.37956 Transcript_13879/m.37956 type:complete len:209 (+) Transcript_13879:1652-2278(+)